MPQSESVTKIVSALAKAQTKFTVVKKTKKGQEGNRSFMYADLADVLNMLTPVLNAEGIFLSHPLVIRDGKLRQTTKVQLEDEFIQSDGIALSDTETPGKQLGIEVTYARRIDNNAFFGIFPDDDLDAPDLKDKPPLKAQGNVPQSRQQAAQNSVPGNQRPVVVNSPVLVTSLPPVKSPEELASAVALRNTEITDNDLPDNMSSPLPPEERLPAESAQAAESMEDHLTKERYAEIQTFLKDIVSSKVCSQRAILVFLQSRHGEDKGFFVPASRWETTIKEIEDAKAQGPEALKKLLAGAK